MEDLAQYLIYIPIPQSINQQFEQWNSYINSKYHNTYKTYVDGKWSAHLMIYLSPMPAENVSKIMQQTELIASTLTSFEVEFDQFTSKPDGFVFMETTPKSKQLLENIHTKFVEALLPYRDGKIKSKYLERWDNFSDKEKKNIETKGIPYDYEPHITVAKVDPSELNIAYQDLVTTYNAAFSFEVDQINILRFENGINTVLGKFMFKSLSTK